MRASAKITLSKKRQHDYPFSTCSRIARRLYSTPGERGVRISEMPSFFLSIGLRLVEVGGESVTLPAEEVRAMRVLARKGLRFIAGDEEK